MFVCMYAYSQFRLKHAVQLQQKAVHIPKKHGDEHCVGEEPPS